MKTRIRINVGGEYNSDIYIETPELLEIKIMSARKFIITTTPPITIETSDNITEVKLIEV